MTRTARSAYPRAVTKDRSESKSGLDKSEKKHGAGPHNWGSLINERELESGAVWDEEREFEEDEEEGVTRAVVGENIDRPAVARSPSSMSEEDVAQAVKVRKNALRNGSVDLSTIARSSAAVSTSPPNRTIPIVTDADTSTIVEA